MNANPFSANPFHRLLRMTVATIFALAPMLCAAQLYKCTDKGASTYQSQPCEGAGTVVHVDPGPSEQSVKEAKERAAKDVQAAAAIDALNKRKAANAQMQGFANPLARPAPDCAKLKQDLENAYGQRNGMVQATKGMGPVSGDLRANLDQSAANINQRLAAAQQASNQAGCQ